MPLDTCSTAVRVVARSRPHHSPSSEGAEFVILVHQYHMITYEPNEVRSCTRTRYSPKAEYDTWYAEVVMRFVLRASFGEKE